MTERASRFSVSIAQGRIGSGLLALGFALVAVFMVWPWPNQTYSLGMMVVTLVNVALAFVFIRQAMKHVAITSDHVIVANWNRTRRIPLSQAQIFTARPPRQYSRISMRPVLVLADERTIRLDALVPTLGSIGIDTDITAALHQLNTELNARKGLHGGQRTA